VRELRLGLWIAGLLALAACSHPGGNVGSADEIANKLAAANIACTLRNTKPPPSPATSLVSCGNPTSNVGNKIFDIYVYRSHDQAFAAYQAYCRGFQPGTQPGGITEHLWLGGNWLMHTFTTASADDINNALGAVSDTDCQHTT